MIRVVGTAEVTFPLTKIKTIRHKVKKVLKKYFEVKKIAKKIWLKNEENLLFTTLYFFDKLDFDTFDASDFLVQGVLVL